MIAENEICYFLRPGKLHECGALNIECTGTRSPELCKFRKTAKEFFESRNRAVMRNRLRGNCARCKYKDVPCEIIEIGGCSNESNDA